MRGSSIYQQALKEIRRIEKAARRIAKRGYEFDLPFRKTKSGTEKTRYTRKELEYLKSIKGKDLYQYATYEGRSGEERRQEERREASRKAAETRKRKANEWDFDPYKAREDYMSVASTIISNFLDRSKFVKLNYGPDKYFRDEAYNYVVKFIDRLIADPDVGQTGVAWMLEDANNNGLVTEIHLSYWWEIRMNMDGLTPYLPKQYQDDIEIINFSEDDNSDTYPTNLNENEDFNSYFR